MHEQAEWIAVYLDVSAGECIDGSEAIGDVMARPNCWGDYDFRQMTDAERAKWAAPESKQQPRLWMCRCHAPARYAIDEGEEELFPLVYSGRY